MTTTKLGPQHPVGDWVAEAWSRAGTFQRLGIDFSSGGRLPLAQACEQKGVSLAEALVQLDAPHEKSLEDEHNWAIEPMPDLVAHIVSAHHDYLRDTLPSLGQLVRKVAKQHGARHPELVELREAFTRFETEILGHLLREEELLFPLFLDYDRGDRPIGGPPLHTPIMFMEDDHERSDHDLAAMRRLTNGFKAPEEASEDWQALVSGLETLEANTFRHVHLENHLLFPRALKLAA